MLEMPARHRFVVPDLGQAGVDQPPAQLVRAAQVASQRAVFVESAEVQGVAGSHAHAGPSVGQQGPPLILLKLADVTEVVRIRMV